MKNIKPFGPSIGKNKISNKFFDKLNKEFTVKSRSKKIDYSSKLASQIKNELKNLILDTLNKGTVKDTGFLNYEYLYNNVIKPHIDNKSNNHKKIWNVFVLVNWLKNNKLI